MDTDSRASEVYKAFTESGLRFDFLPHGGRENFSYLRGIVDAGFGTRTIFGSDQMVWPEAMEIAIQNIERADFLTADKTRNILSYNAATFLRLANVKSGLPRD